MGVSGCDAAISTITANFEARNDDVKAAIAMDLSFEAIEKITFKLGNFAASETSHVDVIPLRTTFVKMFFALQVHEVELVDKALPFEKIQGAIDGDATICGSSFGRGAIFRRSRCCLAVSTTLRIVRRWRVMRSPRDISSACRRPGASVCGRGMMTFYNFTSGGMASCNCVATIGD
jgi:hypothetical protein